MKLNAVKLLAIVIMGAGMMYGQASRTWVSGVGDDANPCSRTAPCKTFAGAISKTAAGGEIDALDPAGFGALTITKAITLDGGGGQVASVLVAGTNGIVVQAGPNDVVILRNLRINGIVGSGNGGINGIRFLSGKDLNVENCYIFGFTTNGLDIALNQATQATVHVFHSVFKQNNGVGIRATNAVLPPVKVAVDFTEIALDNIGVEAAARSQFEINNSMISGGATAGISADSATGDGIIGIDHSEVVANNNGATASGGSVVVTGDTTYVLNSGTALNQSGTGKIFSYGTNRVHDNGSTGSTQPVIAQQ
ncbi:MAG TPA: right-handed parallel beta-helix repeat-containing protein [Candidatus Angelobacter sp.]|nr:right-handed parallel beta-helix repeat-containing protein [Candidatus Angelobacter sp.]